MQLKKISESQKAQYNKLVTHPLQSWEWGEFRESIGTLVERFGIYENDKLITAFQLTFHKIPFTKYFVGYLPKGPFPDKNLSNALKQIGKEYNCAFIKLEPNIEVTSHKSQVTSEFKKSPKSLFTKYNFVLDITKPEEELLKNMSQKTRYNIKIAQKHEVKIEERTDEQALEIYLKLYFETTKRQNYHGHTPAYHKKVWESLQKTNIVRFLIASYNKKPLTAWMLINFKDTLYYPYGGSSIEHREVMANNLVAWEAIKLGKKLNLKEFDMWGALGPDADSKDPWFGFHKFKQGYGGRLEEYIGTYDLVFNYPLYWVFTSIDKLQPLKLFLLKFIK